MKRSPKKSPLSDPSQVCALCSIVDLSHFAISIHSSLCFSLFLLTTSWFLLQDSEPADEPSSLHPQDDHATDEEKLASTNHKWAALHEMDADLNSDQQDFPQPCDLTSFVNENSLPHPSLGEALVSYSLGSLFVAPATCVQKQMTSEIRVYHRQAVLKGKSKLFG